MKNYPQHYQQFVSLIGDLNTEIPETMKGFNLLHKAAIADGALSTKNKELIALGIAIAVHCDGCIAFHIHDALKAGANHEEIIETIGVSVMMGGGPSLIYGCEALAALRQFVVKQDEEVVSN